MTTIFRNEGKIQTYSDEGNRKFISNILGPPEMLKEVLHAERN